MPEENVITDIETALKQTLENPAVVQLNGQPVPVVFVTPDPDLVELTIPCMTLQLTEVRRDPVRADNDRDIEIDEEDSTARIRWPSQPYNLHYTLAGHAAAGREDRLLLEQLLRFVDDNPALESAVLRRRFLLHRDVAVKETSRGRDLSKALAFVVRTRLTGKEIGEVPLAREQVTRVGEGIEGG